MSNILLPSNLSTNVFKSPTNQALASTGNLILTIPTRPGAANTDSERRFALITSFLICNKTAGGLAVTAQLANANTSGYLLYQVNIPSGTAFEVIQANKFIMKEGDSLYVWHNSANANAIDVVVSYVQHDPITPYSV